MSKKKLSEIHNVDRYVGVRLRARRVELGVSQEELAKYVKLTFQQIQKYEKGLNRISCSKLHDFSQYLRVDIDYFFKGLQEACDSGNRTSFSVGGMLSDVSDGVYTVEIPKGAVCGDDATLKMLIMSFSRLKDHKLKECVVYMIKALGDSKLGS
ncbi:Transcriptional regulator XRE family [Alphaproteobacteria bacterium]